MLSEDSQGLRRVAVLVPRIGLPSEVFIARHISCVGSDVRVISRQQPVEDDMAWGRDLRFEVIPRATPVAMRMAQAQSLMRYGSRHVLQRGTKGQRRALLQIVEKRKADTVLVQYLHSWLPYLRDLVQAGTRVFGHAHGYDVSTVLRSRPWVRAYRLWNEAEGVVVPSRLIKERLAGLGIDEERIHVVPYGVEVPSEPPTPPRPADRFRFLAVGRLVPKKSPLITLEAFRRLRDRAPGAELHMVGDGPLRGEVERYVAEKGMSEVVTVWGAQPHDRVRSLLGNAHAFVQHSRTDLETGDEEGLPVALLEAMAHGLPVVATRHAGIPEAVVEGETGHLVNEGDTQAMCDVMAELVHASDRGRSMGIAGWRRAATRFSVEQQCVSLRRLLLGQ